MRRARHKSQESTFYHIITRVAGAPHFRPLEQWEPWKQLLSMIDQYTQAYCCVLVSFEIMGTHYHLILWMEKFRHLSREELKRRAFRLWGHKAELKTANWGKEAWDRFNRRLFDLSALMQHLNGEYAKWYNRTYDRHGHFWGDRFKNPELLDLDAVQRCLAYIETNATRAHLVELPEQFEASSAWLRFHHQDQQLMPLHKIFPEVPADQAFETYRRRLEERRQADLAKEREAAEAESAGKDGGRQRFFTDGIAIGSSQNVARVLEQYQAQGHYLRRKHPIPQLDGQLFTLREQRSHARS